MNKNERVSMIIEYAKKVLQYPKGTAGYDPIDEMNLQHAIEQYEISEQEQIAEILHEEQGKWSVREFEKVVGTLNIGQKYVMPENFYFDWVEITKDINNVYNWNAKVSGQIVFAKHKKGFRTEEAAKKALVGYMSVFLKQPASIKPEIPYTYTNSPKPEEPVIEAVAKDNVNNFESFTNLVNGYPLNKKCYLPVTFRYKTFEVSDFNGGYSWSAEYNRKHAGMGGYVYPMLNSSRIQTFKTEAGARRSLIKYMENLFKK